MRARPDHDCVAFDDMRQVVEQVLWGGRALLLKVCTSCPNGPLLLLLLLPLLLLLLLLQTLLILLVLLLGAAAATAATAEW